MTENDQRPIQQFKKILSLSGGGARGMYTISVLAELEESLTRTTGNEVNLGHYFDLIAGTSIGGILALGLASGKSARALKECFKGSAGKIFKKRFWRKLPLYKDLYDPEPLKQAIISMLGDDMFIRDLSRRVVIPTVDISNGAPFFVKTCHKDGWYRDDKLNLVDVALATSAAPTYFPPHRMAEQYFSDGGLVANNPVLIACHEANKFLQWEHFKVLSVGTLSQGFSFDHGRIESRRGGYLGLWSHGRDLVELILSTNETMHGYMAKQSLPEKCLFEIDDKVPEQQSSKIRLDNASKQALEMMIARGARSGNLATSNSDLMETFFAMEAAPFIHPHAARQH